MKTFWAPGKDLPGQGVARNDMCEDSLGVETKQDFLFNINNLAVTLAVASTRLLALSIAAPTSAAATNTTGCEH